MDDQTTLASLHQTVADTRVQTDEMRKTTLAKKARASPSGLVSAGP